jgi:RHS repeat-associated protein
MITRDPAGAGAESLQWDAEGRLQTDTVAANSATNTPQTTTSYLYDASGNELIRRDSGGTNAGATLYLGTTELHLNPAGTTVTGNRYYSYPGAPEIVASSSGALSYEITNSQGTGSTTLDATTNHVTARRYTTPYGTPRDAGAATTFGTFPDDHTFLGKTTDASTGLVDVGARKYDPATGRFISADPIFQPDSPQAIGGYAYTGDDPVNFSDPSGSMEQFSGDDWFWAVNFGSEAEPAQSLGDALATLGSIAAKTAEVAAAGAGHWVAQGADAAINGNPWVQTAHLAGDVLGVKTPDISVTKKYDKFVTGHGIATQRQMDAVAKIIDFATMFTGIGEAKDAAAIGDAAKEAAAVAAKDAAKGGGDDAAASAVEHEGASCPNIVPHSFTAPTPVLMADGSTKPISQIKVGDTISNADPVTHTEQKHRVDAVIVTHTDHDFADVTVATPSGNQTIHTTYHHPFYVADKAAFVEAADLNPGDSLKTADGTPATIAAVHLFHASQTTYDLTIDGLHTYYVVAGDTPVLVHNYNCTPGVQYGSGRLSQAVQKLRIADKNRGNNYAAALLKDPQTGQELGIVVGRSAGKVHAEEGIINALRNGELPGLDESHIAEMYSEFQPCATRCSKLLGQLPNLQGVSWSWDWDKSGTPLAIVSTAARDAAVAGLF